jgi:hypothetical protein
MTDDHVFFVFSKGITCAHCGLISDIIFMLSLHYCTYINLKPKVDICSSMRAVIYFVIREIINSNLN